MLIPLPSHRAGQFDVERLECRRLLSAVVTVSPGYQDSTQAIQNALNQAGSGGTVNLAAGSYNVSSTLTIPSGVKLEGNRQATLNWTSGDGTMLYSPWNCNGTTVDGVTFNGAGYKLDPGSSNITISNNTFQNINFSDAYTGNGLYIPDEMSNSTITDNTFSNITGNVGIYIFNSINTQITYNTFNYVSEPIKGQWTNGGSNDLIAYNTLSEVYRFGIECQGNPNNLTVSYNRLGNWQQRDSHIGLSIATGEGNGININNNTILGTGISNPNTPYTAIEAMGNNLTISGNFATGWGWAELIGNTNHWVTMNNTWGVNTAVWVIEGGGVNPSVDSNNVNVALNASPPTSSSPPVPPANPTPSAIPSSSGTSGSNSSSSTSSTPTGQTTESPSAATGKTSNTPSSSTGSNATPSASPAQSAPSAPTAIPGVAATSSAVDSTVGIPTSNATAALETVAAPLSRKGKLARHRKPTPAKRIHQKLTKPKPAKPAKKKAKHA